MRCAGGPVNQLGAGIVKMVGAVEVAGRMLGGSPMLTTN